MTEGVTEGVRLLAGRYQVGELIGRGGMADVHLGTDARLGRRVAIKLLKSSLANDPAFRSRFRREAQDAAKMAHPTIVRIFDAGEETVVDASGIESVVPFIVMEYVDGRMLRDLIAEKPCEPAEAVRIIEQVLTALEYSHRAGVVHRDIKPGNIMITSNGQVKVMDFGIARAISDSSATIAETSAIVGTAQYFSPEQARGETVDARSDLYSTGIVLFELLTGRPPFTGENPVAVAYQHVNAEAVPPSSINPKVSPALDAVVLRSIAKDRFERFQSASEFRDDVETAAAGEIPTRKLPAANDFNATLFGVNPTATAGSEATLRQLTVDEDDRAVRTQTRPPVAWIWAGITAMAVIVVAVLFWAFNLTPTPLTSNNVSVSVPNIVDKPYDEGLAALDAVDLPGQKFSEPSDTVAAGLVIRTDPSSGINVAPKTPVKVWVSLGPDMTKVPQTSNMAEADARAAIEAAGFTVGTVTASHSPNIAAGIVIGTTPEGTQSAAAGSAVNLLISDGLVTVPDVRGKTVAEASAILSGPDVQLSITAEADRGCSGGMVSSQSLDPGDHPQRSTVTIRYCAG